jgi:hypothetical protein
MGTHSEDSHRKFNLFLHAHLKLQVVVRYGIGSIPRKFMTTELVYQPFSNFIRYV